MAAAEKITHFLTHFWGGGEKPRSQTKIYSTLFRLISAQKIPDFCPKSSANMFNSCHQLQEKPLGNIDFRAVFPWGEFVGEIGAEIAIKSVSDG